MEVNNLLISGVARIGKVKFTHTIDSHSNDQHNDTTSEDHDEVADEGEFTKLPNGDDLEIGEMPAPHLGGKVAAYREIWRELKSSLDSEGLTSITSMPLNWYLESLGDGDDYDGKAGSGKRSFYARAGKFFLAIRRTEARMSGAGNNAVKYGFAAIRQEIVDNEKSKWTTQYSIGDQVEDMLKLSDSGTFESGFVVENESRDNNLPWQVDDRLVIRNSHDGTIREMCIVRAVS